MKMVGKVMQKKNDEKKPDLIIGSADLDFESSVWFRQVDLSSQLANLPQKPYKLFIASLNYGLGIHPGDEEPTSPAEAKSIFSNWHAATTADYYTFVVFGEESSLDAVQKVLAESSAKLAGPVTRIYWHKTDKKVIYMLGVHAVQMCPSFGWGVSSTMFT